MEWIKTIIVYEWIVPFIQQQLMECCNRWNNKQIDLYTVDKELTSRIANQLTRDKRI